MSTTLRLTLKQHRFGILGFGVVLLAFAAGAAVMAAYIGSLGLAACENITTPACMAVSQQLSAVNGPTSLLRAASLPVAVLAGVFIGVPIVATEIERGTAVLPWTLGGSRIGWFAARVAILGAVVAVLGVLVGLALDALQQSINPAIPITANLTDYEGRGWLIPSRALVGFAAGVLAGALLGRTLPALLAGLVLGFALVAAVIPVGSGWNQASQVDVTGDRGAIDLGLAVRDQTSGILLDYQEAEAIMPQADPNFSARFREVRLGVPGSDAPVVVLREVAAHGLEIVVVLGLSGLAVNQRRPY